MKYMGEVAYFMGIKIYRDRSRHLIGLSQITYTDKVLNKFKIHDSKKRFIPIQHGLALSITQFPSSNRELEKMDQVLYASIMAINHV